MADHTELIKKLRCIADFASEDALDLLDLAYIEGTAREAAELLESSDVLPKVRPSGLQPQPAVGQVWRNRLTDRLVRITHTDRRSTRWEALTGQGQMDGVRLTSNWRSQFAYVETPEEGSTDE